MKIIEEPFKDLKVIEPYVFEDSRGYFYESYNYDKFHNIGIDVNFVQDNQSLSQKGVLRGMHFQLEPFAQDKLVRIIKGSVHDVVIDLRKKSDTYGKVYSIVLTEKNKLQLFVPKGFAHGFETLEDNTIFSYKCSNFYVPSLENSILWNDEILNILWKTKNPILSNKDRMGLSWKDFKSSF